MSDKKNDSGIKKKNEGGKETKPQDTPKVSKEAKDPQPSSTSPQGPQKQNDPTRALIIILAVVAVVVGLVYVYPFFTTMFGKQKEVFTSVNQLGQRVVKLEEKVHKIGDSLHEFQANVSKDYAQKDSLELLKNRLDLIEKQHKSLSNARVQKELGGLLKKDAKMSKTIENLMNRVESLEKEHAVRQARLTKIPATLREFAKLRESIQTTKPFVTDLNKAMSLVGPNDASVQERLPRLKEIAKQGVLSYEQLEREFSTVAAQIKRQSVTKNLPWYKRFVERMRTLIVVKKQDESIFGGSQMDKVLAEIKKELNQHDLDAALALTHKLPPIELKAYKTWLRHAKNRQFINNIFPLLETSALNHLLKGENNKA